MKTIPQILSAELNQPEAYIPHTDTSDDGLTHEAAVSFRSDKNHLFGIRPPETL